MNGNRLKVFVLLVALSFAFWFSYCAPPVRSPRLPWKKDFTGVVTRVFGSQTLKGKKVTDVILTVNRKMREGRAGSKLVGVAAEDAALPILDMVAVRTGDDGLIYTDVPHVVKGSQALRSRKLVMGDLTVSAACASIGQSYKLSPHRNVLCPLDSGYRFKASVQSAVETLVLRPLYHTNMYRPYHTEGRTMPQAATGRSHFAPAYNMQLSGAHGAHGGIGRDGQNGGPGRSAQRKGVSGGHGGNGGSGGPGQDGDPGLPARQYGQQGGPGEEGQPGADGANGGYGGNGYRGDNAGRGDDGRRAEDGPRLNVTIRPIYSKFYPDEELLYMEVHATWHDNSGRQYAQGTLNYIFHKGQKFNATSQGGKGGDGGIGGRGGDGGHGGNGGNGGAGGRGGRGGDGGKGGLGYPAKGIYAGRQGPGGDGANGGSGGNGAKGGRGAKSGNGGPGGSGGRGGDGGQITVTYLGSSSFVSQAVRNIRFNSVPGPGGRAGPGGRNGDPGNAGRGGFGGAGGYGGQGGYGYHSGQQGRQGKGGRGGFHGNSGPYNGYSSSDGRAGGKGVSKNIRRAKP